MKLQLWVRMIAPTAAISLLLLAVGIGTAWYVHTMQRNISNTLQVNVSSMRAAEELEIVLREVRTMVHSYLLSGKSAYLDRIHLLRPEINRWLAEAVRWATTPQEQVIMNQVQRNLETFFVDLDRCYPTGSTGSPNQLRKLVDDYLTREILEPTHEYLDYNEKEVEKTSRQNRIQAGRLIFGLLLLGVCGSTAGLVCGLGLARTINRSLIQLSVPLRAVAGQLDEVIGPIRFVVHGVPKFDGIGSWDLVELEQGFQQIAERIGTMVERLRQSEREVLQSEQLAAVGQMAAGMAHELRNPLTAMKILVQAAQDRPGGHRPLSDRDLSVLEQEITRLERVIHTFLQFARPPQPEKRLIEVQPLIETSISLVEARAELCAVRIEVNLPGEPISVVLDPGQFRQVMLNLMLNALDAVAAGGLIEVELICPDQYHLCLSVADNGTGLPQDLGDRIFSPFVSTKETGLGLGLSISRRIIEAHGGEMTAEDSPQGGAVFVIRLPLPGDDVL